MAKKKAQEQPKPKVEAPVVEAKETETATATETVDESGQMEVEFPDTETEETDKPSESSSEDTAEESEGSDEADGAAENDEAEEAPAEEAEAEAEETETVAEETEDEAVEEVDDGEAEEEARPDKLAKFRKGKLIDEEAVAAEIEAKEQIQAQNEIIADVMRNSKEARVAYFKAVKARGMALNEQAQREVDESEAEAPKAKAAAAKAEGSTEIEGLSRADAEKEFKRILTAQGEFAAQEFLADWKAAQRTAGVRQELEPLKKRQAEDEKQRKDEQARREQGERQATIFKQLRLVAKKFPSTVKIHGDGRIEYRDKRLWDGFRKANADGKFGHGMSMIDGVRYVLTAQGRLKKKGKTAAPAPKPKPGVPAKSTARTTEVKPRAKAGEMLIEMDGVN